MNSDFTFANMVDFRKLTVILIKPVVAFYQLKYFEV